LKIIFQAIGVLVHYNFALPHYLTRMEGIEEIRLLIGLFPIFMGGYYYLHRPPKKLRATIYKSGVDFIDKQCLSGLLGVRRLNHVVQKPHKYDVIHLNSPEHLVSFEKLKIPKLFVLHGSPDNINTQGCKALEELYSKVDAFVAVSFHAARMLRNKCDFEPTHVIHHGVDVELFNPLTYSKNQARRVLGLPEDKKIILWNARLSPEKKIETLLYAIPKVLKSYKNLMLVVKTRAVDKAYKMKVKKLVKKLNLDKHVLFDESWTPLTKLPPYYRAVDVYVNTSTSEAFGSLTMLEAMACGVPTIANKASSNPEAVGDGGLLYNYNDPLDLAEKIVELLNNEKLMRTMSRKAVNRVVKELQLRNTAMTYLRVYANL